MLLWATQDEKTPDGRSVKHGIRRTREDTLGMFTPQKERLKREDGCLRYTHVQVPPIRTPYSAPGSLNDLAGHPSPPPHHVTAAAPDPQQLRRGGADAAVCARAALERTPRRVNYHNSVPNLKCPNYSKLPPLFQVETSQMQLLLPSEVTADEQRRVNWFRGMSWGARSCLSSNGTCNLEPKAFSQHRRG